MTRPAGAGNATRYDAIGAGYAGTRREDPAFRATIHAALGGARSVVNVGAGAGSYEPEDRLVTAIEPSAVMAAQRPPHRVPAVLASADALPLTDDCADAAMAIMTLHHWDDGRRAGVAELVRVARERVVILTYEPAISGDMWLIRDHLPEVAALDRTIFPPCDELASWLPGDVRVETLPYPADSPDWMLGSFWAHPERVLDSAARAATSGWARMEPAVVDRAVAAVTADLESGRWDAEHGHLRTQPTYDVGLRLVVAEL